MKKLKNLLIVLGSVLVLAACQNSYGDDDYYPSATPDSSKTATDNSEGSDSTSSSSGSSSDESSDSSSESTGDSSSSDSGNSSDSANGENGNGSSSSDSTSSGNSSESNGNSEADNSNGNSSSGSGSSSSSSSGDSSSSSGDISSGSSSSGSGDASNSGSSSGTGDSSGNGSSDYEDDYFEQHPQPSDFGTKADFDIWWEKLDIHDNNEYHWINHFVYSRLDGDISKAISNISNNPEKLILGHWNWKTQKWEESAAEGFWRGTDSQFPKFSDKSVYLSSIFGLSSSPYRDLLRAGYYYLSVEYNGTEYKSYFKVSLLDEIKQFFN